MELVTGATGYVGGRLSRRLLGEGRAVRALARDPRRVERAATAWRRCAATCSAAAALDAALDGCETAYYLVHSMEALGRRRGFADRDRRAAEASARAAADARASSASSTWAGSCPTGGRRVRRTSRSRLEVEEILLDAVPGSTALRASIVIGAGSSSFRILVRLVERLRVLPLPALARATARSRSTSATRSSSWRARPRCPGAAGRSLDIAGPDVVTLRRAWSSGSPS